MNTLFYFTIEEQSKKIHSIIETVEKNWCHIRGKYLHHIRITVPLVDTGDFRTNAYDLNRLVRILCNHRQSIRNVDNRAWWSSFVEGGCYTINIKQTDRESPINVTYDIICLSNRENINNKTIELQLRLQKIFPYATSTVSVPVQLNQQTDFETVIIHSLRHSSNVSVESDAFVMLNKYLKRWILQMLNKDIRAIGSLYLMLHRPGKSAVTHVPLT